MVEDNKQASAVSEEQVKPAIKSALKKKNSKDLDMKKSVSIGVDVD